ncbi:MAG TPA: hypothetical protein ENF92_08005 [Desulfobacteraceae bacterium]|nr:hypothetical protein [Desulfobacteraceae bacterium]
MSWLFQRYPFSSILDFKPGFFLGWFLYKLFGKVQIDEHARQNLREIQREGAIVYVTKYPGHLDFLLYHFRLRKSRLPYPRIGLDLNMAPFFPISQLFKMGRFYIAHLLKYRQRPNPYQSGLLKEALQKGFPILLCLLHPKRFKRQFVEESKDPIGYLLEIQETLERPIFLVPSLVLYKQAPERDPKGLLSILLGYRDNPGPLRKIFLFFRHNRRAFIDLGSPMNLQQVLGSALQQSIPRAEIAARIRERIIGDIDTQKKAIIGPVIRSRQELKEKVLNDQEVLKTIERLSKGRPEKQRQLKTKAAEYFDEIAADYSPTYVVLTYSILTRFWKRLFQGIEIDTADLVQVRNWARKGPVIFVPSHKSHIDYLILNYLLYEHYVQVPRIAAGQNLAFWPAGHIFRKCGAFFIRRTFSGARLYTKVFSSYIGQLLREGYFIEFFIEGGRSRSGKLVLPKTGFLAILLDAYLKGHCEDLIFVPASIAYDRVMEERSYMREQKGEAKERESFRQVLKARQLLKKKYGKIYIRFGEPFSLRDYLGRSQARSNELEASLALKLVCAINEVTPVTPLALISSAILSRVKKSFDRATIYHDTEALLSFLRDQNATMASSLSNLSSAMNETLHLLVSWRVINPVEELRGKDEVYSVNPKKRREIAYYKNSIIHFFVDHSLVAVCLLSGKEPDKSMDTILVDHDFLKQLLKNEFVFDEQNQPLKSISYFQRQGLIEPYPSDKVFRVTKKGYRYLPLWAGLVKEFLDSYWIAAKALASSDPKRRKRNDLLKRMGSLGNKLLDSGVIEVEEAVSHITFNNAFVYLNETILRSRREEATTDEEVTAQAEALADRIYSFSSSISG